jgi:hypothetical protein
MRLSVFYQRGVENDALRVADLADRFDHACDTVFSRAERQARGPNGSGVRLFVY